MEIVQDIIQIVGLGIVAAVFLVLLRQTRPELALLLSLAAGALIFLAVLGRITSILDILEELAFRANISGAYLATVLKIIGVAYIAEFGAQVLRDSNENAVASKVEMAGKVIIMILAIPIVVAIVETISRMLA